MKPSGATVVRKYKTEKIKINAATNRVVLEDHNRYRFFCFILKALSLIHNAARTRSFVVGFFVVSEALNRKRANGKAVAVAGFVISQV